MLRTLSLAALSVLLAAATLPAKPKNTTASPPRGESKPSRDDVVKLQIYLDEQNFSPGKIDGQYGGFTAKSWQRYQQAEGVAPTDKFDVKTFTSIDPIYTTYHVAPDDLSALGTVPKQLAEQAKNKVLPYTSMAEMLGERYHVGVDFLRQLNAGKNLDQLKEGDTVKVPNVVPPFNLAQVIALRQYTSERAKAIKDAKLAPPGKGKDKASEPPASTPPAEMPGPTVPVSASPPPAAAVPMPTVAAVPSPAPPPEEAASAAPDVAPASTPPNAAADNRPVLRAVPADSSRLVFHVSTKDSYLEVRDGDRLVACFPITPGSTAIPTPKGEWHVVAKTLLPEFRWDKSVLMTGKRSNTFYQLPPGPNNPVGITWIALNKPGIGMHGTAEPDTIGRSASHGCIRLSNWDAFKVFGMVAPGTKVIIE